jgi:pheromone a factor receptor
MMGSSVGLPAASLCINRRLYHIASVQSVSITRSDVCIDILVSLILTETSLDSQKLRAILIDSLICVVFPLVFVALRE